MANKITGYILVIMSWLLMILGALQFLTAMPTDLATEGAYIQLLNDVAFAGFLFFAGWLFWEFSSFFRQ
jgi:hypothetical protein